MQGRRREISSALRISQIKNKQYIWLKTKEEEEEEIKTHLPSILSTFDDELALYSGEEIFFSPFDDRTVMVRFNLSDRRRRSPINAYRTVITVIGNTKNRTVDSVNDTVESSMSVSISCMGRMLHCGISGKSSNEKTVNCNAYYSEQKSSLSRVFFAI